MARQARNTFDLAGGERDVQASMAGALATIASATNPDDSAFTLPVNVLSGGIASGAVASGAVASGAYASGSISDGANVALGARADAAWSSGNGTVIALLKKLVAQNEEIKTLLTSIETNTGT